jgi:hypothetical protein
MKYYQIILAIVFLGLFMGAYSQVQVLQPEEDSFLETAETNTLSDDFKGLNEGNDDEFYENEVSLNVNLSN